MKNQYGKLSLAHLRELIQLESALAVDQREVLPQLRLRPDKWKVVVENLIPWATYYDESVIIQLAGYLRAFGLSHEIIQAAKSSDPHQFLLDSLKQHDSDEISPEMGNAVLKAYGLLIGMCNTLDSLRIFGRYLNELVEDGKNGNDKAFFDAIRIDPTVVCTKGFEARLSRAAIENDADFMKDLRSALQGKTKKHETQINRVRWAIRALLDSGGLDLPDDELYELFVNKLKIYAPGEDAPKALRKHIRKQKKHSTTQKRRI